MQILHQVKNRVASYSYQLIFLFMMILFTALTKPPMLFDQFMWAEMATNYFKNAHLGFFEQLMVTDYGYLQFTQRFITYIGHILQIPTNLIPYFYNWSSLMMIFLILAPFISSRYEVIIREKSLRLAVVLIIFLIADFESINFISFSYFGLFLLLIESIRLFWIRKVVWYDYLLPLLILSKPILLVFYPIFFALLLLIRTKEFLFIFIALSLLVILQMTTAMDYIGNSALTSVNSSININGQTLMNALALLFSSFAKVIFFEFIHNYYVALILGFAVSIYLFKNFNYENRINLLIILSATFGGILFNSLVLNNWQQPDEMFDKRLFRQNIFIYMNYILLIAITVSNFKSFTFFARFKSINKHKPWILFLSFLILSLLLPMHIYKNGYKINNPKLSASNGWENFSNSNLSEYCYSINPAGWLFSNTNCKIYRNPELIDHRITKFSFSKNKSNNIKIRIPSNSLPKELIAFSLSIKLDDKKNIYRKDKIACELNIYDANNNLIINRSSIFMMRSGMGNVEFNFEPILSENPDYFFELICDKEFYYDDAGIEKTNFLILGRP